MPFEIVVIDAPQHLQVHYYDSFDWLCYRAGKTLEWHDNTPASCFLLRSGKNGPVEQQMNLESPPPRFPAELPKGDLSKNTQAVLWTTRHAARSRH